MQAAVVHAIEKKTPRYYMRFCSSLLLFCSECTKYDQKQKQKKAKILNSFSARSIRVWYTANDMHYTYTQYTHVINAAALQCVCELRIFLFVVAVVAVHRLRRCRRGIRGRVKLEPMPATYQELLNSKNDKLKAIIFGRIE